jgi:hypothetical protein
MKPLLAASESLGVPKASTHTVFNILEVILVSFLSHIICLGIPKTTSHAQREHTRGLLGCEGVISLYLMLSVKSSRISFVV